MNEKKPVTQTGEFWMVFAALAYAMGNIFDKLGMSNVTTDTFIGGFIKEFPQMLLPLIFILIGLDKKQFGVQTVPKRSFKENLSIYKWFIFCGVVSELVASVLFLQAVKLGGINVAVPTVQIWTLMGAVLGIVFLKEKSTDPTSSSARPSPWPAWWCSPTASLWACPCRPSGTWAWCSP